MFHHEAYATFAAQAKEKGHLREDSSVSRTTRLVRTILEILDNMQTAVNQITDQSIAQK
jgi:hypothetical protein